MCWQCPLSIFRIATSITIKHKEVIWVRQNKFDLVQCNSKQTHRKHSNKHTITPTHQQTNKQITKCCCQLAAAMIFVTLHIQYGTVCKRPEFLEGIRFSAAAAVYKIMHCSLGLMLSTPCPPVTALAVTLRYTVPLVQSLVCRHIGELLFVVVFLHLGWWIFFLASVTCFSYPLNSLNRIWICASTPYSAKNKIVWLQDFRLFHEKNNNNLVNLRNCAKSC